MRLKNLCLYEVMYEVLFELKHRVMNDTIPASAARCVLNDFRKGISELDSYLGKLGETAQISKAPSCKEYVDCYYDVNADACAYKEFEGVSYLYESESQN